MAPRKARVPQKKTSQTNDRDTTVSAEREVSALGSLATDTFPVVGIGASAGGLEAFTDLLRALPTDTGLALVLVQHLDPTHASMLPEILSRVTTMPVHQAANGARIAPNEVYVIPPNTDMDLQDGHLQLTVRQGAPVHHMPIDHFLRSLAADRGNRAIGVI